MTQAFVDFLAGAGSARDFINRTVAQYMSTFPKGTMYTVQHSIAPEIGSRFVLVLSITTPPNVKPLITWEEFEAGKPIPEIKKPKIPISMLSDGESIDAPKKKK